MIDKSVMGGIYMYFVDREQIEETLQYIDSILKELKQHNYSNVMERFALERMTQVIIESIIDVGNMMIDGFIMRDPGSYEDIIDILVDEQVLLEDESDDYKEVILLREMLVKDYLNIQHAVLKETLFQKRSVLEQFSTKIRNYLRDETDVAHAFSNNE